MIYVALLRGINVGVKNRLDMKSLKAEFEGLGYTKVLTYINSGNIIFESGKDDIKVISNDLEAMIKHRFGLEIRVLVKSLPQIEQICSTIPDHYSNDENMKCDVMFLWEETDSPEALDQLKPKPDIDRLHYTPGAVIWSIDKMDYNRSSVPKLIGTKIYSMMTVRNVNTTRKLLELMQKIS